VMVVKRQEREEVAERSPQAALEKERRARKEANEWWRLTT
jgi:hypothetical protein